MIECVVIAVHLIRRFAVICGDPQAGILQTDEHRATNVAPERLKRLLPGFEPPSMPVQIVVPSSRLIALAIRAFHGPCDKGIRHTCRDPITASTSKVGTFQERS
jgi:hypothetical protein